jgi:hypothetical protein
MFLKTKIPNYEIINYYYAVAILVYFSAIYFPSIRVGLFMSIIMCVGIFIFIKNNKFKINNSLDIIVILYLLYNILTLIFYTVNNLPFSIFFKEFSNSILPIILFYFFGKLKHDNSFYHITLYSVFFCFLISFYYQLTLPMNFMQRLNVIDGSGTNPIGYLTQYTSFLGITVTGSLGAIALFLAFVMMYENNFKKGKFFFIICVLAVILSLRRAALYTSVFSILFFNLIILFKSRRKLKLFVFEFIIALIAIFFLYDLNSEYYLTFTDRFFSLSSAVAERSSSWYNGLSNVFSIVTGDGLGRYGHKVLGYSEIFIADGNYFKMIGEVGVLGTLLFLSILLKVIYTGFLNINTHYIQLLIILIICLQAVGSNVFAMQLIAPIFWYSIGACNKLDYRLTNTKL